MCIVGRWHGVPFCAAAVSIAFASSSLRGDATFSDEAKVRGISYVVTQGAFGGPGQYGCGVALFDADADGDEDLVCSGGEPLSLALFENNGAGQFLDRTATAGLGSPNKPSGLAAGDYDADGDLDLCVTRWLGPPILFRNDGDLHFTDVTLAAGWITVGVSAGTSAAWGDYDGDGWLDALVCNRSQTGAPVKNRLFRNLGNGTFVDVAPSLGVNDGFATFQGSWCDVDRDGDLDMYVANDKGTPGLSWNRLFRNTGSGAFVEATGSGADVSLDSMGICFADLTDDFAPDIFIANVPSGNMLLEAKSSGLYANVASAAGVVGFATCWGGIAFDADHDGDTDLFFTTSSPGKDFLFERNGPWPYLDRSKSSGVGVLGESYCHAVGDVDADGDLDLVVQQRDHNIRLFINHADLSVGRRWVKFRPVGLGPDRQAIGLQLEATYTGGVAWRQAEAGSGYKSHSPTTLHIGLGQAQNAGSVVCRWPNGAGSRTLVGYGANRTWTLYPTARLGDLQGDGVLGADDYAGIGFCRGAAFLPGCEIFDFDGNATVNDADLAAFLGRYCDLTGDAAVRAEDLGELLGRWGNTADSPGDGDFDGSGAVDVEDLVLLLAGWD